MSENDDFGDIDTTDDEEMKAAVEASTPKARPRQLALADTGDNLEEFMVSSGLKSERTVPDITKPWMKHHEFVLVQTVAEVEQIVDAAIASGKASLDLETEGLDNRIYYNAQGEPETVHKIVGFCIAYGDAKTGYYIPVRHRPTDGGPAYNVEPVEAVETAITRLCDAAQPEIDPSDPDQLSGKKWVTPPRVILHFWHASFDQEFLFPVTGIDWWHPDGFEDGNLACFVRYSDDKNLSLKDKAPELLRDPDGNPYEMIGIKELFPNRRKIDFPSLSPDEPGVKKYACSDAICTLLLGDHPRATWAMKDPRFAATYRNEKQTAQVKRVMERPRVLINKGKVRELLAAAEEKREKLRQQICDLAAQRGFPDFEPGSPKQLSDFLFTPAGLDINPKPPRNEKSQQFKTDANTLEELVKELGSNAPPVLTWIVSFREQDKLIGTYLASMEANGDAQGEFRFQFKQTGAATGRFSAPAGEPEHGYSGIPIHGIPATSDLRTCFEAREGYLMVKCDYAGEELRIVTNLSNEPVWVNEFATGDGDLHTITARAFFPGHDNEPSDKKKEQRKMAKIANFALVYGGGPASIQRATGCDKLEAQRRKQAFDKALPVFASWVKSQHARVKKELGVFTAFGRWVAIPDAAIKEGDLDSYGNRVTAEDANRIRAACERHATNYPIQGSGADIMKIAMILIHKELHKRRWLKNGGDDSVRMLLTVHDELVFEIKHHRVLEALDVITEAMERPSRMAPARYSPPWQVPLVTDPLVGKTWGAETGCHRAKEGVPLKEGEIQLGNWVFKKIPAWLLQLLAPDGTPPAAPPPASPPPVPPPPVPPSSGVVEVAPRAPAAPLEAEAAPRRADSIVTLHLGKLDRITVAHLRSLCACHLKEDGPRLRLLYSLSGDVLIDPSLGIRVDADALAENLLSLNLSDGKYSLSS